MVIPPKALAIPRFTIAAPRSGEGKTTVTIGLMAALRRRGEQVAPFKVGPDYIDPGYHTLAAGRPGRNLDPHLCGEDLIVPLLLHGAADSSVAVIEGVMGLHDGRLGTDGFGSTAHVSRLTSSPVVLVIDAAHSSRSVAAVVHGMATYDMSVQVAGVILNRCGSDRLDREIRAALRHTGIPCLGTLPRAPEVVVPSRHLGLVPAAERDEAAGALDAAADLVAEHIDLDALLTIAATAPAVTGRAWTPAEHVAKVAGRPRVAVATGRAFTFRYPETDELLQAAGCEVIHIDPISDTALPEGISGLYIGGGFPQVYAGELAASPLAAEISAAIAAGLPTVAECAGLLYLCQSLDGVPMAGALALEARMTPRLTLGYHEAEATCDTLIARAGERVNAHEFHRTTVEPLDRHGLTAAWRVGEREEGWSADPAGTGRPTLHASYQHLHWAGNPLLAQRFAAAASTFCQEPRAWKHPQEHPRCAVDLTHHGDQDLQAGLVDLAVNTRAQQPPSWLRDLLTAGASDWGRYPDAAQARTAIARRHGVSENMVLPTAGGAEAFTLMARAYAGRQPVVVHPQFTEPEQALLVAGHKPLRVVLRRSDGFRLAPALERGVIAASADLVVIGNPTNPTGVLHPRGALLGLRRPGRMVVVDEAFMDTVPAEPESLIDSDMEGLLVFRSLTKTWSLAGIRAGYAIGDPELIARLAAHQPPWSVGTPAADAMVACCSERARSETSQVATQIAADRGVLVVELTQAGFHVVPDPQTPFVLVDTSSLGATSVREALADRGFAVRRGESFPGLGPSWIRVAVRDEATSRTFVAELAGLLAASP